MNYDEFAFFNQQLAAMLRDGIPLEGALKQLSAGMKDAPLRAELSQLETDLSRGTPLAEALARRKLPGFYIHMVEIGARSNDLPGVLTLLADYYQNANTLWTRLKGLMVYPVIVIAVALALTTILSFVFKHFLAVMLESFPFTPWAVIAGMWLPPILLAIALVAGLVAILNPAFREKLRWQLPAFREASLAQLASAMALMLKNGLPLPDALALAEAMESNTPAGQALAQWRQLIATGQGKPAQWPQAMRPFPPMFLWLVRKGGEDLSAGFRKAAEIYQARASYRIELALYGALPVSVLLLGLMVIAEVYPLFHSLIAFMNMLGGNGGGIE
jgi:type II secretory pathway component PulF